jgi:OOP family OmpA-OmpF porin
MQITEIAAQDTEGLDGDAVSGLISAIQSFVQDSFSQDPTAMLADFKVGDHNVWVAHGPKLMLACVILGDAPEGLKGDLNDALYKIRTDYANPIASLDRDIERFNGVDDILQPLMQLRLKEAGSAISRSSQRNSIPFIVVGLMLFYFAYQWFAQNNKPSTVEYFLRQAPGIAATDIYWKKGMLVVEGLKDPDAKVPYGALEAYDIDRQVLAFKMIPFRSLKVNMALQRFRNELTLPSGVYLSVRNGVIFLYGEAPIGWLNTNDARIRQLAADNRLTISALSASPESVSD